MSIKNTYHKNTRSKESGLRLQTLVTYFKLNNEHNWKDMCISIKEINKHALSTTTTNSIQGGPILNLTYADVSIVDLLLQHEFCCINLIGGGLRTWTTNHTTPTYLRGYHATTSIVYGVLCMREGSNGSKVTHVQHSYTGNVSCSQKVLHLFCLWWILFGIMGHVHDSNQISSIRLQKVAMCCEEADMIHLQKLELRAERTLYSRRPLARKGPKFLFIYLFIWTKGHFTHEPRAVTMKLWEPKGKCLKGRPNTPPKSCTMVTDPQV